MNHSSVHFVVDCNENLPYKLVSIIFVILAPHELSYAPHWTSTSRLCVVNDVFNLSFQHAHVLMFSLLDLTRDEALDLLKKCVEEVSLRSFSSLISVNVVFSVLSVLLGTSLSSESWAFALWESTSKVRHEWHYLSIGPVQSTLSVASVQLSGAEELDRAVGKEVSTNHRNSQIKIHFMSAPTRRTQQFDLLIHQHAHSHTGSLYKLLQILLIGWQHINR